MFDKTGFIAFVGSASGLSYANGLDNIEKAYTVDIDAELLLDQVSRDRKLEYLRRLFPGCNIRQVREFVALLEAWFAAEGSLQTAAELMFIHKNTIQYRLKRLAEVTGLDVRRPSQSTALYLAMRIFLELDADREGLVI